MVRLDRLFEYYHALYSHSPVRLCLQMYVLKRKLQYLWKVKKKNILLAMQDLPEIWKNPK